MVRRSARLAAASTVSNVEARNISAAPSHSSVPPKKRKLPEAREELSSSEDDASDDDDVPFTVDDAGIVGSTVQIPTPGVWQTIRDAVNRGARSVTAVRIALGGRVRNVQDEHKLLDFFVECAIACLVPPHRGALEEGDVVRIFVSGAWAYARVESARHVSVMGDDPISLDSTPWWYVASHDATTVDIPRGTPLNILSPKPSAATLARVADIRKLPRLVQEMAFTKRVGEGGAIGNRAARRAILVLDDHQTSEERTRRESLHRNGAGWGRYHAAQGAALATKIAHGTPLTREEAAACRELALHYSRQVVESEHLAFIWGNDSDDGPLGDAYDDEDAEEDEETFYAEEVTDSVFYRHAKGRFLSPHLYRAIAAMKTRDAAAVFASVSPGTTGEVSIFFF